mgnify:CR=1 FL=1
MWATALKIGKAKSLEETVVMTRGEPDSKPNVVGIVVKRASYGTQQRARKHRENQEKKPDMI